MRTQNPRKVKPLAVKSAVKKSQPLPAKKSQPKKLSKSDPNYYSKIGAISAAKRQISSEIFSAMAKLSHKNRPKSGYRGGRKPKQEQSQT